PLSVSLSFNPPATTLISTLSLHDALPIYPRGCRLARAHHLPGRGHLHRPPVFHQPQPAEHPHQDGAGPRNPRRLYRCARRATPRSEEHTSELQSLRHLVCRLLLEKKNKKI